VVLFVVCEVSMVRMDSWGDWKEEFMQKGEDFVAYLLNFEKHKRTNEKIREDNS